MVFLDLIFYMITYSKTQTSHTLIFSMYVYESVYVLIRVCVCVRGFVCEIETPSSGIMVGSWTAGR